VSHLPKKINRTIGLIIPDVHEQFVKLTMILRFYKHVDWVVFLGDFMDTFDGLTWQTWEIVKWLAENLANPKYIFLWGNHDLGYAFYKAFECSGFDKNKLEIVQKYLNDQHWKNFKLIHWLGPYGTLDPGNSVQPQEWMISHAGIHPRLLNPVLGPDKAWLQEKTEIAMEQLRYGGAISDYLAWGRGRGGIANVGGLVWLDWQTEFTPIEGLNQIVGHSYAPNVRIKQGPNSYNYCIDTHLNNVIEVKEDGTLKVVKVNF
jgi:3',5'-cyclic AMP phosphodiesterase CpdA